jgi:hypothetical protein
MSQHQLSGLHVESEGKDSKIAIIHALPFIKSGQIILRQAMRVLDLFIKRDTHHLHKEIIVSEAHANSSYFPICPECGTNQYIGSTQKAQCQRNDPRQFFKLGKHGYLDTGCCIGQIDHHCSETLQHCA